MFLSSKDEYVHHFLCFLNHHNQQSYIYSNVTFKYALRIFISSLVLLLRITKHTYRKRRTPVHENIHNHQNLFRKRTGGDEEVLLNSECLKENMSGWVFIWKKKKVRSLKSKHRTERKVRECKVCSLPVYRNLHRPKSVFQVTLLFYFLVFSVLIKLVPLSGHLNLLFVSKMCCFRIEMGIPLQPIWLV